MKQAPLLHPKKVATGSISSIGALCHALDISMAELAKAQALPGEQRYTLGRVPKKDGSERFVYNPHFLIRTIQRRINKRIFSNADVIRWPSHVFGSIPNSSSVHGDDYDKDYVSCARRHCGAKSILSADIKDFFDNIHQEQVAHIFSKFLNYSDDVAEVLADICCLDSHVVQGALTSSYLATLCLFEVEGDLVKKLAHKGLVYTRFVDDITVSSKISGYDFGYALKQLEVTLHLLGLPLNEKKTKLQYASMAPLMVHGLRVDFAEPRLPPEEPRKIRAAVKNIELLAASPGYRASRAYRRDYNRCMGRVNKLHRVGHSQHEPLLERLKKILPLASHKDIERAEKLISKLQKDFSRPGRAETFWFYKCYYAASVQLGVLKRSFPKKADELRQLLQSMTPPKYE